MNLIVCVTVVGIVLGLCSIITAKTKPLQFLGAICMFGNAAVLFNHLFLT